MQFSQEIKRILAGMIIAFGLVGLTSTYWAIVGPDTITQRDDNPRLIEDILHINRGSIYDRENHLLVQSTGSNNERIREYLVPSTYSPIGYYSLRYGESGVESAFNEALNGTIEINTLESYFEREILDVAPVGSDIQLTLDVDVQDTLVSAIGDYQGAGVVMNAQTGEILALASLPTFNPNTLDEDWDALREAEGNPFFNRALQGQYQPGGIMYTLWMAQAILTRYDTNQLIANATDTISLGDSTFVDCVVEPNQSDLSLNQAYQFGCPVPFAVYSRITPDQTYADLVSTFSLNDQISLDGFPIPEPITPTSGTQTEIDADPALEALRDTLGQGNITVTPLHVTGILAAIANNGNAPSPVMLERIRPPDTGEWLPVESTPPSLPMMTTTTARQLRGVMQSNWQTIQSDTYRETIVVGANVALSLSGDASQLWLVGFVRTEQAGHAAFVVLLEDTRDVQAIIPIGQNLIQRLIDELDQ